jgi:hypothetical protein
VQATFRGSLGRGIARKLRKAARSVAAIAAAAEVLQCAWRSCCARRCAQRKRDARALLLMAGARRRAAQELAAVTIQQLFRY